MKPRALVPLLWLPILAGCDLGAAAVGGPALGAPSIARPPEPTPAPQNDDPVAPPPPGPTYRATVDHLYLPLAPGARWVYEGEQDGVPRHEETRVLAQRRTILGVSCTTVVEEVTDDGELVEVTRTWLAQDTAGNVWRFGEESVEYEDGQPVAGGDSWEAGVDGARPWIVLAADPRAGDVYSGNRAGGWDQVNVVSLSESATVPAGSFEGCLATVETNPDDPEDADRIIYAPGLGLVSERSTAGAIELVAYFAPGS